MFSQSLSSACVQKERVCVLSCSVISDFLRPVACQAPWGSPGKNTGVGCHFLLHRKRVSSSRASSSSYKDRLIKQNPTSFNPNCLYKLEKAMAPHSSTLAWKIPWTEEPGALHSMGSLRVGHDWVTSLPLFTSMHWRRKWQPTPVFLPGESQGWWSLVGYHLWGRTESDTTEVT